MLPREGLVPSFWGGWGEGELSPEGFGQFTGCSIRQEAGPMRGGAGSAQHSSNDPMLIRAMDIATVPAAAWAQTPKHYGHCGSTDHSNQHIPMAAWPQGTSVVTDG